LWHFSSSRLIKMSSETGTIFPLRNQLKCCSKIPNDKHQSEFQVRFHFIRVWIKHHQLFLNPISGSGSWGSECSIFHILKPFLISVYILTILFRKIRVLFMKENNLNFEDVFTRIFPKFVYNSVISIPGSGSVFGIRIRIQQPKWIRTDPNPQPLRHGGNVLFHS